MSALDLLEARLANSQPITIDDLGGVDEICVIGGGQIYAQVFDRADVLHVTHVAAEVEGDTRFPAIDPALFDKVLEEPIPRGEKDSHAMRFVTWRRKTAG